MKLRVLACVLGIGLSAGTWIAQAGDSLDHENHRHDKSPANRPSNLEIHGPASQAHKSTPDPATLRLLAQVDPNALKAVVDRLTAIEDRSVRSRGIQDATNLLFAAFQRFGYAPERQCFRRETGGDICNVVAIKAAATPTQDMVVVVGHFDSIGKPRAGADDNASGTAGVLEIARLLKPLQSRANIIFAAVNGEEQGLWGSKYLVQQLQTAGQLRNIRLAVVMDMVGYNTGHVDVETFEAHRALGQGFVNEIASYVPGLPARLVIPGWGSDHIPFLEKGVPSFLVIDDTDVDTPCYHKECDLPATIDYAYFAKMVRVSLLAVAKSAGVAP